MNTIAIIGASIGQLALCKKAKAMGFEVICFAWPKGAVCKAVVDRFYPISVIEKEKIVEICLKEKIVGVVTNASDLTILTASYVSENLGLYGNPEQVIAQILDKRWVRQQTNTIPGLTQVRCLKYDTNTQRIPFPCVVKPATGSSKKGVSFVDDDLHLEKAILYAQSISQDVMLEEYVSGQEYSVETISFKGIHYPIQITEKITTGFPHFVELQHHQPSALPFSLCEQVKSMCISILNAIGFQNGPAHIEVKIDEDGHIYLIEINPRGGGDRIADTLVFLSTGYDFLGSMIDVSLGNFKKPDIHPTGMHSGIFYLCRQSLHLLPYFTTESKPEWMVERVFNGDPYREALGNADRSGYFIYQSDTKLVL